MQDDRAVQHGGVGPDGVGISKRSEIMRNIDHHRHMVKASSWLASLDLPVRLIALPEGALQGFNDEVLDLDHATFAENCAIDVPGPGPKRSARSAGSTGCT